MDALYGGGDTGTEVEIQALSQHSWIQDAGHRVRF